MVCNTSTHYKKACPLKVERLVCIAIRASDLPFILLSRTPQCNLILDVHEYVQRDIIMKATNKTQIYRLIYYS